MGILPLLLTETIVPRDSGPIVQGDDRVFAVKII